MDKQQLTILDLDILNKKNGRQFFYLLSILLFTIFFFQNPTYAQDSSSKELLVSSIEVKGLKKTKESYLKQFITTKVGKQFNQKTAELDLQNLKNLYAVANAIYQIDTIENKLTVVFEIEEALTLFPIISFGGVEGNIWYQIGLVDINWLGKGNQLSAYYLNNDKRHNASIYYRVPSWKGSRWGNSFSFLKWASREPTYFPEGEVLYNYDNTSASISSIFNIKNNQYAEIGGTYFVEKYQKLEEQQLLNPPGPDFLELPKFLIKSSHKINKLNYHYFYVSGIDNYLQIENVHNIEGGDWFHVIKNDFKYFKRIGEKGNFGLRARFGLSTNVNTPFAPFVLDSQTNIRGAGNRRDRGTATTTLNLEYRYTLYDRDGSYEKRKKEPRRQNSDFAVQVVVFSDIGTWRSPGGTLEELVSDATLQHFAGAGFRFIYKKAFNAILRIDYGVELYDRTSQGFVIGVGQYF